MIDHMNNMMNVLELSSQQIRDIHQFRKKTDPSKDFQQNLDDLLSDLSYSKQIQTVSSKYRSALFSNPVIGLFLYSKYP